jgi:hypothetical protein
MKENRLTKEKEIMERAAALLRELIPSGWLVKIAFAEPSTGAPDQKQLRPDAFMTLRASDGSSSTMVVEARRSLSPREVDAVFAMFARLKVPAGGCLGLVVTPWLSQRTQDLLAADNINYLDLTGNVLLKLDNPALFIKTTGATRQPNRRPTSQARVRGPKAGRLVRFLADVRPPYNVKEIAEAAGLTSGYVSRLLDTLDSEAIVDRARRGRVETVDYEALLRRWAVYYDLLKRNKAKTFIAPAGATASASQLVSLGSAGRYAVTGSFAATRLAPIAAPSLLAIYTDDAESLASSLGLLPTDEGANVVLLKPFDPVVYERTTQENGLSYVAPSQATVDCLAGNGRMPAEGEALSTWMKENEPLWRFPSLQSFLEGSGAR